MSSLRDRRKHQNRVEATAEALDLNHKTTTGASHALASARLSSSDNPTYVGSLPDDHAHTQAKGDSTNQHMDLYRGATGEHLCSRCNEIKDIFDFEAGIPAKSWRTLDLMARVHIRSTPLGIEAPKKVWKVTNEISQTCSFCSFLMACASRMAHYTAVDLNSHDWFLAFGVRRLIFLPGLASGQPWESYFRTPVLDLKLCRKGDNRNLWVGHEEWKDGHLIIPVQTHSDVDHDISDTLDWELTAKWLDRCQSQHDDNCRTDLTTTSREDIPSFCVIDCETNSIIPAAKMNNPDYVTLSYVWGDSTTTPRVLDASTSLPVLFESSQRPTVVNDAMEVVRRIGYRYLWVDRFCIPQSDHNAKSIQIKNMGNIYSMSVLTIIAAAGSNAEYGLPGVGSRPNLQPVWTTIRSGNRAMPVIHFEAPNNDILKSTWNSRGWTYQEALLSKRRLVFTDRHVYFQCESMQSIGYLDDRQDPGKWPRAAKKSEVFPFRKYYGRLSWTESIWDLINDYTKRMLSYEQDTIHAVQGILESFRDKCDVWFFYGLPIMNPSASDIDNLHNGSTKPDILREAFGTFRAVHSGMQAILHSLLWVAHYWDRTVATHSTRETGFSDQAELRRIGFPSWTWAGWETAKNRVTITSSTPGVPSTPKYYVPDGVPFDIRISYDDQCLTWSRDNQEIQRRSENDNQCPNFLIITGPVFDISIICTDAGDQHTSTHPTGPVVWRYTSHSFLARMGKGFTYEGPPFSVDGVRGNTMDLVALCVLSNYYERIFTLHMLILRPVGEDVHGQIYERVTCAKAPSELLQPHLSIKDINLREMELRIR